MIKDFIFILKMLAFSVVVLIALQVKIGEDTVEDHFHRWVQESVFVGFFQDSADALLIAGKSGLSKVNGQVGIALARFTKKKSPDEDRSLPFTMKRHTANEDGETPLPSAQKH